MSDKRVSSKMSEGTVSDLAQMVDLKLSKKRVRLLTPIFREFLQDLKKMDSLDLGEEPLQLGLRVRRNKNE